MTGKTLSTEVQRKSSWRMRLSRWSDMDYWIQMNGNVSIVAKTLLHMVNESKLRSYKTCKKYMYRFEIPQGYKDAIRLNKLHGNNKWQSAPKLEIDQLNK